jgi:cobalt/nickel transport protein
MKEVRKRWYIAAVVVALGLAVFFSPFASSSPDGLERVAEDRHFADADSVQAWQQSPLPDYTVPGVDSEVLSTSLAGLLGTLATLALGWGLASLLRRRRGGEEGRERA